jgi:hypothetical protein
VFSPFTGDFIVIEVAKHMSAFQSAIDKVKAKETGGGGGGKKGKGGGLSMEQLNAAVAAAVATQMQQLQPQPTSSAVVAAVDQLQGIEEMDVAKVLRHFEKLGDR